MRMRDVIDILLSVFVFVAFVWVANRMIREWWQNLASRNAATIHPRQHPAPTTSAEPPVTHWSGIDHGPLPIRYLTPAQYDCLIHAIQTGTLEDEYVGSSAAPFNRRTVNSLIRHGFMRGIKHGFAVTDAGAQALETLRVRW